MGWRDWLGRSSKTVVAPRSMLTPFLLEGEELVEVVGESFYQPALLRQCRARRGDPVRFPCRAYLVAQPDNPYDRNAVAVQIGGQLVGHLSRSEAPRWLPLVQQLAARGYAASCEAMIAGRGREGETDHLGVFLHLPTPTEAHAQVAKLAT
ncbi:MAG: hypothetical protein E6G34_02745 [Actinobacteria bacterium]|nr:MAG: hypothetical protein E6G34_02745 [Actinomycetota bacterium]